MVGRMIVIVSCVAFALLLILGALALISLPLFLLWNWLMPAIFNLPNMNIFQAIGMNIFLAIVATALAAGR